MGEAGGKIGRPGLFESGCFGVGIPFVVVIEARKLKPIPRGVVTVSDFVGRLGRSSTRQLRVGEVPSKWKKRVERR